MQTQDNAIVRLSFVVQYKFADAYQSRYSLEDPLSILRDAAQAAVREVVGRMTIEDVRKHFRAAAAPVALREQAKARRQEKLVQLFTARMSQAFRVVYSRCVTIPV